MQDDQLTDSQLQWQPSTPNWWRAPRIVSGSETGPALQEEVSLLVGGMRCLLTAELSTVANQLCHLVPKDSKSKELEKLQYAWGRPFSPDNRWNVFFLTPTLHAMMDYNTWTLVPDLDTVLEIETKIRAELDTRRQNGETGPWPDFRSRDWFPIVKNTRYNYAFLPLTINTYIFRLEQQPDQSGIPYKVYAPPYEGFPTLRSHVHPYMVITNAAPKLKKHPDMFQDGGPRAALYNAVLFIYDTWITAADSALPKPCPSHSTSSGAQGSSLPKRDEHGPQRSTHQDPCIVVQYDGNKTENSTEQTATDQITDSLMGSDGEPRAGNWESYVSGPSRSPLSTSVPDGSVTFLDHAMHPSIDVSSPKCKVHPLRPQQTPSRNPAVRMWENLYDWVNGANAARDGQELSLVHDPLGSLEHYEREPARAAFCGDWHEWRSMYASQHTQLKDRSMFSSNDWAEIEEGALLTGTLADNV